MSLRSLEAAANHVMLVPSGNVVSGGGSEGILRQGYLKKLKTQRKKYFVLRSDGGSADAPARLEYYDSEKKFASGAPPKRSIPLKNCFNINRRLDLKHKYVIALYTKDDSFCVVTDSEEDVDGWLKALLNVQQGGEEAKDGETLKPTFEHVWQVTVLNRGLGTLGLTGTYRLCLTDKTLSLIKRDHEIPQVELNLSNIRSCGNLRAFFFLEIGRSSTLGAGELWMETEDHNIASNVHSTVFHAMSASCGKEDLLGPKSRNRSSSATESSKSSIGRKPMGPSVPKPNLLTQDTPPSTTTTSASTDTSPQVPSSICQSQHPGVSGVASFYQHLLFHRATPKASRRHSISVGGGGVTWSGNISHQRTQSLPLANPAPISDHNTTSSQPSRVANKRPSNQSSKCVGGAGGRERCDSMPSRARTTSEGNHVPSWTHQRYHLNAYRPSSLYARDMSHSPPGGSPVSPPSVGCSTDSAGSSYSLADETDCCQQEHEQSLLGRYGHSLTPDEAIAEEDCVDCPSGRVYAVGGGLYLPMEVISDDGYVDMSPRGRSHSHNHNNSPTASMSSVTSGTPSTDMRFAEYPLEKVTSYFAPCEEDETSRPARAYSVGSRPETYRYKKCMELASSSVDSRVRAFSVGSKTKKIYNKVLPPHASSGHYGTHQVGGGKSSSAPILNTSRVQGSHGSIGPMDDLMEMDFSRSGSEVNAGYMEMKPKAKINNHYGYVDMNPGSNNGGPEVDASPYVDMTSGSSPARQNQDYMEMDPRKNSLNNNNHFDYTEMDLPWYKHRSAGGTNSSNVNAPPVGSNQMIIDYKSDGGVKPARNDGYVEMSIRPSSVNHQRMSSLDSVEIAYENEDYTNMSVGSGKAKKRERKSSAIATTRSQPIAIQNALPTQQKHQSDSSASPPAAFGSSLWGRKYSTGTPPKMNLPLSGGASSPFSSLPGRNKSRKNSRRNSKDSSSSSVVTTPSSSSTIFPISLNSPCSPVNKPPEVPVTSSSSSSVAIKVPPSVLNTVYRKSPTTTTTSNVTKSSDYVMMEGEGSSSADYVNFGRGQSPLANRVAALGLEEAGFRPIDENREESFDSGESTAYELLRQRPSSQSRPSSTSSELCSSSSTIVGSRPESVNSDRVRPSSVTSGDVVLHYASLDLDDGNRSPRTVKGDLTYADIDFVKSETLKQSIPPANKVKH